MTNGDPAPLLTGFSPNRWQIKTFPTLWV